MSGDEQKRSEISSAEPSRSRAAPDTPRLWNARLYKWAFAAVPIVGVLELGALGVQTLQVVPSGDWQAAKAFVAAQSKPEDLVAFAPRWADPVGRQEFGNSLATLEREARADETRFPRAFEVAIRGKHVAALSDWRRASVQQFGGVTVTVWENPAPAHILDDLVSDAIPTRLRVSRVDGNVEADCPFGHAGFQTGGLGSGTPVPDFRFVCPGGFVAVSVLEDASYAPRRCIDARPFGGRNVLRLRFSDVRFGHTLHGHHSLYVEAEHSMRTPVNIAFSVDGAVIGRAVHRDMESWKPFEFDTSDRAGTTGELTVDIQSDTAERRMYCFEADTR
ncbi:MAG TPA: hypothetical protein VK841_07160 [Polyangiaceae bacterium]|nr:hypothetical protein [Polyangiaceae bacterium]